MDILTFPLDLFLMVTYLGVSAYLALVYLRWKENTIGLWSIGSYFATISVFFNMMSNVPQFFPRENLAQLSFVFAFISFSVLAIAHQVARRKNLDLILVSLLSANLGIILILIFTDLEFKIFTNRIILVRDEGFHSIDLALVFFFVLLLVILVRDSTIIYQSSIKRRNKSYYRSTALAHLISWQFFYWGLALVWYLTKISKYSSFIPLIFQLPMLLLLVPILTLGSRPFDWAREGYEPRMLLLLDNNGNVAYSWQKSESSPLLLEGGTLSTIEQMLNDVAGDDLYKMNLTYKGSAMYIRLKNNYLSVLITDGNHPSFDILLSKIHEILLSHVSSPIEFGSPNELPNELRWLLKQLISDN